MNNNKISYDCSELVLKYVLPMPIVASGYPKTLKRIHSIESNTDFIENLQILSEIIIALQFLREKYFLQKDNIYIILQLLNNM